jgi:acetoin utilization deacetylase AcuC-like enzyme
MRIVYSPRYGIDIGAHVFPTTKYALVAKRLVESGAAAARDFIEPQPAAWDELAIVHTPEYLQRLQSGGFSVEELAQLEVPWSTELVEAFRIMTGGTILASRLVLGGDAARNGMPRGPSTTVATDPQVVAHLGGGLHHAFANHGEGFCVFNDVAVAIRLLHSGRPACRAAVIDLDVHHGNGTAFIFSGDSRVFTFSMHQEHNYPAYKPRGSLDIGLPDGIGDRDYLERLGRALPAVFAHAPDILFYLAGADPFEDDQLGGLAITKTGLRQRDQVVIRSARERGVPLVVCLAGGYARHLSDTVDIHVATIEEALRS